MRGKAELIKKIDKMTCFICRYEKRDKNGSKISDKNGSKISDKNDSKINDKNILQESNYNRTVRSRLFHLDSLFFPEHQERGERQRRFCSLH